MDGKTNRKKSSPPIIPEIISGEQYVIGLQDWMMIIPTLWESLLKMLLELDFSR